MADRTNTPIDPGGNPPQPRNPGGGGTPQDKQAQCQALAAQMEQLSKELVDLQAAVNRGGPQLQQLIAQLNQVQAQFNAVQARRKQLGCG